MTYTLEQLRALVIPADTTPEAAWVQMNVYRRMSPEQRLRLTLDMNDSARALCAAGVRSRHPEFNDEQVRMEVIRLCLGNDLFFKAFPKGESPP